MSLEANMHRLSGRCTGLRSLLLGALALAGMALPAAAQGKIAADVWNLQTDGAYLGIEMEEVTADNVAPYKLSSERGVIVRAVAEGSPAEAAGLKQKDVILEFGGTAVFSSTQFSRLVRETPAGRTVELVVSRDGKKMTLPAKVGKRAGGPGMGRRGAMVVPGDGTEKHFEFRVPAPDQSQFGWFGDEGPPFGFPRGGRHSYSNGKPRLGVTLQPLTDQMAEFLGVPGKKGMLVTSVIADSPASGKLRAGDVIVKADEAVVSNPEDLTEVIQKKDTDGKVDLVIVRDKKQMTVSVVLAREDSKGTKGGFRL